MVTIRRGDTPEGDIDRLVGLVQEREPLEVLVGLPSSLSGKPGPAARLAHDYAVVIAQRVAPVPVRLVDERLSTVTAQHRLHEAGVRGRRHRGVVDQAAAVVILQAALDTERSSGRPPGALVAPGEPEPEGPATGEQAREAGPW